MIALEVTLNGKRICVAGTEDLSVLNAIVTASGRLGKKTVTVRPNETYDIHYHVGGLTSRSDPTKDVHLRWQKFRALKIGDVIQIRVLETAQADGPKSRTKAKRPKAKRMHSK
jgi:hypothetical protein